jgi:hypothetical protein
VIFKNFSGAVGGTDAERLPSRKTGVESPHFFWIKVPETHFQRAPSELRAKVVAAA